MVRAFEAYRKEVEAGVFPATEHSLEMDEAVWQEFSKGDEESPRV